MEWLSFQFGPLADAMRQDVNPGTINDLSDRLHDFADTAAALGQCDALVSVDSAVAHVAGAIGLPTYLMLPRVADWRWMIDRPDSPWYPRHQLFRQRTAGEWGPVLTEVADALRRDLFT